MSVNSRPEVKPIRLPHGVIAYSYDSAVARMYEFLKYALLNNRREEVEECVRVIESWRNSDNPEERKAYKLFMWGPYKKLYNEAKEYLKEYSHVGINV
ncbi:hypothetical protein [Vulcanisaeta souniana]|uniref:Uncharacterized protein n=1 Tax=Vulcanisaeta souniana JCM 11219 TaxID=1293586 RepID=A0ABM8BJB4_9CREN|nr:hypothetical protein [Vulcanisaeta souniana]BDR91060.1 hypothetical protein Vsou_01530 [Vulcanisaeta souniana JCM 11219]